MDLVPWCNGVLWTLNPAIRVQISVEPSYLTHLPEHSFIRIITEVTLPREEVNTPRVAINDDPEWVAGKKMSLVVLHLN